MKPLRPEIDGNGESSVVAICASAHTITRFQDDDLSAAPDQSLGRAQAGSAGADDYYIIVSA
jgi:hypothetical protein